MKGQEKNAEVQEMLRYWIEQIAAIEMAALVLIVITLGVVVFAWVMLRRSKR